MKLKSSKTKSVDIRNWDQKINLAAHFPTDFRQQIDIESQNRRFGYKET